MTKHTTYEPNASAVNVRDAEERDGLFVVEMPISSDTVARDNVSFSTDRLEGFRAQINGEGPATAGVPLMLDHGKSELGGGSTARYSQLGRLGSVENAELTRDDGATLLTADLMIADPDTLAEEEGDTGEIEAALRWIRYQASLGMLSASVGWSEDLGDRAGDVPGDADLLEVSLTALPSDSSATQPTATASADPPEAAVRGFEALPSRDTSPPDNWGLRGYEPPEPTDAERATEALEALEHLREFHTQDPETPAHKRRDETPPELETIDDVLRAFGYSSSTATVEERLAVFEGDDRRSTHRREEALAHLDTVDEKARKLAQPEVGVPTKYGQSVTHAFGRSVDESRERITDAVETLRGLLTEDEEIAGWGMASVMEAE